MGLTREVTTQIGARQTVSAEIDMARYISARDAKQVPDRLPITRSMPPLPPSRTISRQTSGIVFEDPSGVDQVLDATVVPPNDPEATLGERINGANINLVTGEVRQRGRADTCGSWRKRDRSFTV